MMANHLRPVRSDNEPGPDRGKFLVVLLNAKCSRDELISALKIREDDLLPVAKGMPSMVIRPILGGNDEALHGAYLRLRTSLADAIADDWKSDNSSDPRITSVLSLPFIPNFHFLPSGPDLTPDKS